MNRTVNHMLSRKTPTTLSLVLSMASLGAWDARFSPEEGNVNWLPPEEDYSQNAFILPRPDLQGMSLLTGLVQVDGESNGTPLIARLDENGNVQWSKRLPEPALEDSFDETTLVREDMLLTNVTIGMPGSERELVGNFDPTNNFAPRYRFSMPAPQPDPLNPLGDTFRSYQPQASGDLAIIEIDGTKVNVLMLDSDGNERFARVYTLPSGDDSPFPIPGFSGTTFSFATLTESSSGDYYLTTSGVSFIDQTSKAYALRLDSSGSIIWQAEVELPGSTAFLLPQQDERLVISGGAFGESISSTIAVLSPDGDLDFARSLEGAAVSNSSFFHYSFSGNLLFTASILDGNIGDNPVTDGALFMLSPEGDLLAEAGFGLEDSDLSFHIGTTDDGLYFEFLGQDTEGDGLVNTRLLGRSDENLDNWIFASYTDNANSLPLASVFFSNNNSALMVTQDATGEWVSVNEIGPDLIPLGDCQFHEEADLPLVDPGLVLNPVELTINRDAVSVSDWTDAPALTPETFTLVDTPLIREATCGDSGGDDGDNGGDDGDDPTSLWTDVSPANAEGDKLAGIGWINDTSYPLVWIYAINGWAYILDEGSTLDGIFGWDYVNEFWFWSNDDWGGWYVNLDNPNWGIGGWEKWE
ncbi:MAG TPA: hypothetical protein VJ960_08815 [Oceanipulchritudo sp.]|nr:hypothetical protein [Oceanipulchritudo sp.]